MPIPSIPAYAPTCKSEPTLCCARVGAPVLAVDNRRLAWGSPGDSDSDDLGLTATRFDEVLLRSLTVTLAKSQ